MACTFKRAFGLLTLGCLAAFSLSFPGPSKPAPAKAVGGMAGNGLVFLPNKGQWNANVKFMAKGKNVNWWVTKDGMTMDFYKIQAEKTSKNGTPRGKKFGDVVRFRPLTAQGPVTGLKKIPGTMNFFIGKDKSKWATDVPRYVEALASANKGVATRFYFENGNPRYDFTVEPGCDPSKAGFAISGANSVVAMKNGNVRIDTPYGDIVQKGLVAYQATNGRRTLVACNTKVEGNKVCFVPGKYDHAKPLVIDPILASTFIGGTGDDVVKAVSEDSNAHCFVVGFTSSTNYPVTIGAYQVSLNGSFNGFVSRFVDGYTQLSASTYIGGFGTDFCTAVATTAADTNVYVIGYTTSPNFPTTTSAFQALLNGTQNGFVCKLPWSLQSLTSSTYIGGSATDTPRGMALDGSQNICLTGDTNSSDFPVTAGAFQTFTGTSSTTCFVSKVSNDCTTLLAGTYLGGSASEQGRGIGVDSSGNIFVAGSTSSVNFPTTVGAYQTTLVGSTNAFVSKLNVTLSALSASTYLGGGADEAKALILDSSNEPCITGDTASGSFPTTANAYQTTLNGTLNAFYSKFDSSLTTLMASTYLGGNGNEMPSGIGLDSPLNAIIGGTTTSTNFPTTPDAYQTTAPSSESGFAAKISADATTLMSATYMGGTGAQNVMAFSVDPLGNALMAGDTNSFDYPTTAGAFQTSYSGGNADAFLTQYQFFALSSVSGPTSVVGGYPWQITVNTNANANFDVPISVDDSGSSEFYSFPSTVTVPSGSATASSANIGTYGVDNVSFYTINASYAAVNKSFTLQVNPATLSSIKSLSSAATPPSSFTCEIVLRGRAGPSGTKVTVSCSDPSALTLPATVTVPANLDYAYFTVTANSISSPETVTISGTLSGTTVTTGNISVGTMSLAGITTYPSIINAGMSATGEVWLSQSVNADTTVQLSDDVPGVANFPSSVVVPKGKDYVTFPITTPAGYGGADDITATLGSSSVTAPTLWVSETPVAGIKTFSPAIVGGTSATGEVWFSQNLSGSVSVGLSSDTPAAANVPSTVIVNSPSNYATFAISSSQVTVATTVTLSASFGSATVNATLTVNPQPIARLKVNPTSVHKKQSTTAEVWVGQNVTSDTVVTITCNDPNTTVPATVTIPAGQNYVYFTVTTSLSSASTVTITATLAPSSMQCTLTVT